MQPGWFVAAGDLGSGMTGQWWQLQPWLIALFASTAVPLIPNGQEFGSAHYLPEDDHGAGRRVLGRPLQWKCATDPVGSGTDTERRAAVFHRWATLADGRTETIVVAVNVADADQTLPVPFPVAGGWTDLLGGFASGSWSVEVTDARADVPVGSHWGRLLHHVG